MHARKPNCKTSCCGLLLVVLWPGTERSPPFVYCYRSLLGLILRLLLPRYWFHPQHLDTHTHTHTHTHTPFTHTPPPLSLSHTHTHTHYCKQSRCGWAGLCTLVRNYCLYSLCYSALLDFISYSLGCFSLSLSFSSNNTFQLRRKISTNCTLRFCDPRPAMLCTLARIYCLSLSFIALVDLYVLLNYLFYFLVYLWLSVPKIATPSFTWVLFIYFFCYYFLVV